MMTGRRINGMNGVTAVMFEVVVGVEVGGVVAVAEGGAVAVVVVVVALVAGVVMAVVTAHAHPQPAHNAV